MLLQFLEVAWWMSPGKKKANCSIGYRLVYFEGYDCLYFEIGVQFLTPLYNIIPVPWSCMESGSSVWYSF